jgi:copper chaperone CopZ
MQTRILNVPEVSCGHCERTIKNALQPISGLRNVEVDIPRKQVKVEYNESILDIRTIGGILERQGYPIEAERSASLKGEGPSSCCGSCRI